MPPGGCRASESVDSTVALFGGADGAGAAAEADKLPDWRPEIGVKVAFLFVPHIEQCVSLGSKVSLHRGHT